ncbi:MMPL family transporter [Pseudoalteromonas sp. BZB3]|uniref:efflux RND transporter permease subunit n=1 Tax=Pseudoalteromonas sp. BZB3 TaxID=3136670 RepID=UPI0032C4B214
MSSWREGFISFLLKRWWLPLLSLLVITGFMLTQLVTLKTNATPYFLGAEHPSMQADRYVKKHFTSSGESLFISVINKQSDLFQEKPLNEVYQIHHQLLKVTLTEQSDLQRLSQFGIDQKAQSLIERIKQGGITTTDFDSVNSLINHLNSEHIDYDGKLWLQDFLIRVRPVKKIRSIVSVESITSSDDMIDIHPMMFSVPKTEVELKALKHEALSNPILMGALFEPTGQATNMQVELLIPESDAPNMQKFYLSALNVIEQLQSENSYHLGGPPVVTSQQALSMKQDSDRLFPGVILVVMVILFLMFKSPRGVILPLTVAILSVIWTLGLMAFLGVKQNIVSTMLPVFLISIGVADTIHVLTEFNHEAKSKPRKQAVFDTLKSLWTPMVITTLTTAVGFLSLMSTDIVFIKEFGLFVAIGVIFALIITVLLLPPVLLKLAKTKSIDTNISQFEQESRSERCILVVNRLIAERKKSFLLVITMLVVGCGFSLSQLNIDNKAIKYFDEESQVRIDDEIINQYFAGSMVFSLTLKSNQPDTFKQAENLRKIEQIQHRLAEHADVGFSYSAVDFIKLLNQRLNEDNIDEFKLPIDEGYLVGQYFFLYESSDGRGVFDTVDPTYQTARIIVFNHSDQSTVVEKTLNDVLLFAQTILPENIEIEASGFGELLVSTKNEVIYGQITSLSMSLLGVVILLSIMFKSFKFGVLGAVPLSLTVYFNFSIMPLIGMDLDIGTALVAAIAIGVGVDYAIHFISRFLQHKNMGSNTESAIEAALKAVFRPIIFNTLVLSLGFSVLGFSTFAALANLGYLVAMTMLLSAIATLFILPTLVRLLSEKYLTIPKTTQLNLEGFSK